MSRKEQKKMNELNGKKGITLIALVITIIILLILVGVTINLTIGEHGIFNIAKEAGKNYINAQEYEKTEIDKLFNKIQNINGGTESDAPSIKPIIALEDLKTGDYIKYDTGKSEVGDNGVIICRVLYPTTSEYGLQIISDKNVKEIALGTGNTWEEGKSAYNNAIENLNNEAEAYINTEYAYDARCVGSIPTVIDGIFVDKDKHNGEAGTISISSNYTLPTGWESRDTGCYKSDTNYKTDEAQMKNFGLLYNGSSYWLASIRTGMAGNETYMENSFSVRTILHNYGVYENTYCLRVDNTGNCTIGPFYKNGIRPCISLKSDIIKIISGDGTSDNTAYVIGK
ncbi:MAG: hypothetical protein HFJ58_00235 [Clostridia bacterium]|nr:hypothetical protein [Clostridia bacterium]